MKRALLLLFCCLYFITAHAARNEDSLWIVKHYTKMEHYITMRDSVRLFTSVYLPIDDEEDHPILLTRTPYSCAPYGVDSFRDFWNSYQKAYFREGYIIVIQDVRGKWMSEGQFVDMRPYNPKKKGKDIDESTDAFDTIDWLVKNLPHNNGKVGVFGISYPGFYSLMAAASGHPAVKAVSPQGPATDWYAGDDEHHNGAFFMMDEFDYDDPFGSGLGIPHRRPVSAPPRSVGYPIHDNYKFYLENEPLPKLTKLTGDSIAFWNDLMNHPNYDAWWKERDARPATKGIKCAMLWVGGEFDAEDNWGAWNGFRAAYKNNPDNKFNRLVMGPWYHEQWANADGTHLGNVRFDTNTSVYYQQNLEIPFFNFFLKNKGDVSNIAEANIFITGANQWKNFKQWPPINVKEEKLYLQGDDVLEWKKPKAQKAYSEYTSDPWKPVPYAAAVHFNRTRNYMTDDQRFAERRPDVVSFKTGLLDTDVTITGTVMASLQASISTTDADFVVKLIDVFPDSLYYNKVDIYDNADPILKYPMGGYEMLVHAEIMRGKYRKSLEKPEPFVPNKITPVAFSIGDVAHTFKKGHRIMVQVQSSWFPLVDLNPQTFVNIYKAKKSDFKKSTIRIYHDKEHPSYLVLPVLAH